MPNRKKKSGDMSTLKDAGPWMQPELQNDPTEVLIDLRETEHMLSALNTRKKLLKEKLAKLHAEGALAELVDEENSHRYHAEGVSVTLCQGRVKRTWKPEVEAMLEPLFKQISEIELKAEARQEYTTEQAPSYWKVNVQQEL